jgi:hypothetical protein
MKRFVCLMGALLNVIACVAAASAELNIQTGMNYNWWDSDKGDGGDQLLIPVTIDGDYDDFSYSLLTSFAHTQSDAFGDRSRSLSCVVDTKLNFSYALVDRFPADVIFGVDFNLPTGKTKLDRDELALLLDPDLVEISQFGEGLNINPTVALAKVWDSWAAGIGVGYLLRGEYDYSEAVLDYKPGNILSITGEVVGLFSSEWKGRLYGELARYGKDKVRQLDYYEESDFKLIGVEMGYYREVWDTSFCIEGIFRGKSRFQEEGVGLLTEEQSSYGDEYNLSLSGRYLWNDATTVRSQLAYLRVNENDYSQSSPFYIGDRDKVSLLVSVLKKFGPSFNGEFSLGGYILDVGRNWYHNEGRTYKGLMATVMLKKQF